MLWRELGGTELSSLFRQLSRATRPGDFQGLVMLYLAAGPKRAKRHLGLHKREAGSGSAPSFLCLAVALRLWCGRFRAPDWRLQGSPRR